VTNIPDFYSVAVWESLPGNSDLKCGKKAVANASLFFQEVPLPKWWPFIPKCETDDTSFQLDLDALRNPTDFFESVRTRHVEKDKTKLDAIVFQEWSRLQARVKERTGGLYVYDDPDDVYGLPKSLGESSVRRDKKIYGNVSDMVAIPNLCKIRQILHPHNTGVIRDLGLGSRLFSPSTNNPLKTSPEVQRIKATYDVTAAKDTTESILEGEDRNRAMSKAMCVGPSGEAYCLNCVEFCVHCRGFIGAYSSGVICTHCLLLYCQACASVFVHHEEEHPIRPNHSFGNECIFCANSLINFGGLALAIHFRRYPLPGLSRVPEAGFPQLLRNVHRDAHNDSNICYSDGPD